jgi:hypothetical protein
MDIGFVTHYDNMMCQRQKYQRITAKYRRRQGFEEFFARYDEIIEEIIERYVPAQWLDFIDLKK